MKPNRAPKPVAATKRFSLVPATAQQHMYEALRRLKRLNSGSGSGAEIIEIAVCLAIGDDDPVILACRARGARTVRKDCRTVSANGGRLASATVSATAALLNDQKATALVCAGRLEAGEDYRSALSFAGRHKLPILFLVANSLMPGRGQELDLRTIYAEFGVPVFSVDANDAIAAYRVTTEALHNARHLRGPCVIEALTLDGKEPSVASALDLLRDYMERHGNFPE